MDTYPRPGPEGTPDPTGWRRWRMPALVAALVLTGLATAAGLGLALLWAMNPLADEWVCAEGEAPAGNACYRTDRPLPDGLEWDPLGNRPMPSNCDKDGWTLIEHDRRDLQECLSDDLPMPQGWHPAE